MDVVFRREPFLKAFKFVSEVANARSSTEVLRNVKISFRDHQAQLEATDYSNFLGAIVSEVQVNKKVEVLLDAIKFREILTQSSGDDVGLTIAGSKVEISCGQASFRLPTSSPIYSRRSPKLRTPRSYPSWQAT